MPKLKAQIRQDAEQEIFENVRSILRKRAKLRGMTQEDVAVRLAISRNTYINRLKDPRQFSLWDIQKLIELLKIPKDEQLVLVGWAVDILPKKGEARPDGNMDKLAAALDRLTVFLAEKEKAPGDAGTSR